MKASYDVVKYPIVSEKAVMQMNRENKLLFAVEMNANKKSIKKAVEDIFAVKVKSVNTFISRKGEKRAYVALKNETPAADVMTRLGLM